MRRSTLRLVSAAAAVVTLGAVAATDGRPTLAPAVSSSGTARPPIAAAPEFDLAIVRGDDKLEQRDPARNSGVTAVFRVTLKNLGTKRIARVQAGCKLAQVEFRNADPRVSLKPGEERRLALTTKVDWAELPEGVQTISCAATIVEPPQAKDVNAANNTWTGRVMARPAVVPVTIGRQ